MSTDARQTKPVIVDSTVNAATGVRIYGQYGVDWIWHDDTVGYLPVATRTPPPDGWQERLRAEHAELGERLDKLRDFLGDSEDPNPAFLRLDSVDQALLVAQYEHMSAYHYVLGQRVGRIP